MTQDRQPQTDGVPPRDGDQLPPDSLSLTSPVVTQGFTVPLITFPQGDGTQSLTPTAPALATSTLAAGPAISEAELIELSAGTGKLLYYPPALSLEPGDVLYLRERSQPQTENGLIVQVIRKATATYAQVENKVLWRLLTAVRAQELNRSHHEPTEVIDLFLSATFKVQATIVNGTWSPTSGQVVTRNVDIFPIAPAILMSNILRSQPAIDIHLGEFKQQPVTFSGAGLDKVNLITGMKGAGKSHLAKGIIDQSRQKRMSAVVFDINDEYGELPDATVFRPGFNLKFRLDRTEPRTFIDIINRLHPFAERTGFAATAAMSPLFDQRGKAKKLLDIEFLKTQANVVFPGKNNWTTNQQASYVQSLETVEQYHLFATAQEIEQENAVMRRGGSAPATTLSSVFYDLDQRERAGVIVFAIGGQLPIVQRIIVKLVRDVLKDICDRQARLYEKDPHHVPTYPTVFFEEAHMYMDRDDINEMIPVIRHLGMNLFFITNTPGDLPDSVFRLVDNLYMTRLLNEADIKRVAACGLADSETIESFAPEIPKYHALVLSALDGVTKNFPLIFEVRDFGLPKSGVTRSMWRALESAGPARGNEGNRPPPAANGTSHGQ